MYIDPWRAWESPCGPRDPARRFLNVPGHLLAYLNSTHRPIRFWGTIELTCRAVVALSVGGSWRRDPQPWPSPGGSVGCTVLPRGAVALGTRSGPKSCAAGRRLVTARTFFSMMRLRNPCRATKLGWLVMVSMEHFLEKVCLGPGSGVVPSECFTHP